MLTVGLLGVGLLVHLFSWITVMCHVVMLGGLSSLDTCHVTKFLKSLFVVRMCVVVDIAVMVSGHFDHRMGNLSCHVHVAIVPSRAPFSHSFFAQNTPV